MLRRVGSNVGRWCFSRRLKARRCIITVVRLFNVCKILNYCLKTKVTERLDSLKASYLLRGFTEPSRLLFASPSSNTSFISPSRLCSIRSAFQVGDHPIF